MVTSGGNPYAKYNNNKVFTASKEELVLMLYDGSLKFLTQAITYMEERDYEKANSTIIRLQNILREFQVALDDSYEISKDLYALYEYLHGRLIDANSRKDVAILTEVRGFMRALRDTWKEAMSIAKQQQEKGQ